jgi:hypothetical protein
MYKQGKIIPLYKKGSKDDPNNYRPVQLQTAFSKILEKVMLKRLINFMEQNNILIKQQHGFRKSKSTETAIFEYIDNVTSILSTDKHAVGILCDLSKAFDSVNHSILLEKLRHYGVRGTAHNWFRSYLENRKQVVVIRDRDDNNNIKYHYSDAGYVGQGVPQGAILAPLLFLLYINDLPANITYGKLTIFADDTSILIRDKTIEGIERKAKQTMHELGEWLVKNELKLNALKTNVIGFKTRCGQDVKPNINVGNITLKVTKQANFLGVELDQTLTWKGHIKILQGSLAKQCFALRVLKPITTTHTLRMAYFGIFESKMSYGIMFWGNSQQSKKIFTLQKRAIRLIQRLKKTTSCRGYFKKLGVLTFPSLYLFKLLIFIKTNSWQFPKHSHPYGTRKKGNFNIELESMSQIKNQVKQTGLKFYNMLPEDYKEMSILRFKTKLRKVLIENEFYCTDEFEKYIVLTDKPVLV